MNKKRAIKLILLNLCIIFLSLLLITRYTKLTLLDLVKSPWIWIFWISFAAYEVYCVHKRKNNKEKRG